MNLECRVYVYDHHVRYAEVYRDTENVMTIQNGKAMFEGLIEFVKTQVITRLRNTYTAFTVDAYYIDSTNSWAVIEINSPLWLKCGTYLIDYEWQKDRIHNDKTAEQPIRRLSDVKSGNVIEWDENDAQNEI